MKQAGAIIPLDRLTTLISWGINERMSHATTFKEIKTSFFNSNKVKKVITERKTHAGYSNIEVPPYFKLPRFIRREVVQINIRVWECGVGHWYHTMFFFWGGRDLGSPPRLDFGLSILLLPAELGLLIAPVLIGSNEILRNLRVSRLSAFYNCMLFQIWAHSSWCIVAIFQRQPVTHIVHTHLYLALQWSRM